MVKDLGLGGERQTIKAIFGSDEMHLKFYKYMEEHLPSKKDGKKILHTFREIREARDDFYEENEELCVNYFISALESSYVRLAKLAYQYVPQKDEDVTDEKFIGKNAFRHNEMTQGLWCVLYHKDGTPCEELFQRDTLTLGIRTDGSDREQASNLVNFHLGKTEGSSDYNKYQTKKFEKMEASAQLQILIWAAQSNMHPLHISPDVCYYDTLLGVVKASGK